MTFTVPENEFQRMLRDVQRLVSPEVLAERADPIANRYADNYMPSPTAVRSKRWRDNKRYLGNPYRVEVGQVWRRIHKADSEAARVEVIAVGATHAMVTSAIRTTRIRLDRFRPQYQGYERVK